MATTNPPRLRVALSRARSVVVAIGAALLVILLGATASVAGSVPLYDAGYNVTPWPSLDGTQKVVNFTVTADDGLNMMSASSTMYCRNTALTTSERADIADDGTATLTGAATITLGSWSGVTTYTTTYSGSGCTAPAVPIAVRVTSSSHGRIWYEPGPATAPDSTCEPFLRQEQAAHTAGTTAVRFRATSVPGAGWKVYAVNGAYDSETGSLIGTVDPVAISGFAGWYGEDFVTSETDYVRVFRGNSTTCYDTVVVESGEVDIDPPGTGEDSDGADCGLNPFCYTKAALSWAFVPPDTVVTSITDSLDTISEQPPVSVVMFGGEAAGDVLAEFQCFDPGALCGTAPDYDTPGAFEVEGESYSIMANAGTFMDSGWGEAVYRFLQGIIVLAVVIWAFRRVSASFGGKETVTE